MQPGRRPIATVALLAFLVPVVAGCGGSVDAHPDRQVGAYDPRASPLQCLHDAGLPARSLHGDEIDVGRAGIHILFASAPGVAEAYQIDGHAQGAEQVGRALVYPARGSDSLLNVVEDCVDQ
jgi:hypothetical protein